MQTNVRHTPTFTTPELLELSGLTRRQLQQLEDAGALIPLAKGRRGRGRAGVWSVMQAVAAAYAKAFLAAGCHPSWAEEAARWVAAQEPGPLVAAFAEGRTLLALLPTGEGRLVEPYLKPGATRKQRLAAAQLNLQAVYERVWARALELAGRLADAEAGGTAAAGRAARRGK